MNKTELIAAMAEKAGLTKVDAGKALNAYVGRPARTGRNPRTGAKIKIAAKKAAKFKAGKGLL